MYTSVLTKYKVGTTLRHGPRATPTLSWRVYFISGISLKDRLNRGTYLPGYVATLIRSVKCNIHKYVIRHLRTTGDEPTCWDPWAEELDYSYGPHVVSRRCSSSYMVHAKISLLQYIYINTYIADRHTTHSQAGLYIHTRQNHAHLAQRYLDHLGMK